MTASLDEAVGALLWLVFPGACLICRAPAEDGLCDTCADDLLVPFDSPLCPTCGHPRRHLPCSACLEDPPAFAALRAAAPFTGEMAELVHLFKYRDRPCLAHPLGRLLARSARRMSASLGDLAFDVCTCVPMSPTRERTRGYNQADRLGRVVASELSLPYDRRILRRTRSVHAQVGLRREARRENLAGVFEAIGSPAVAEKRILIVDDVSTTGATLRECALALQKAGAGAVYGLVLAAG